MARRSDNRGFFPEDPDADAQHEAVRALHASREGVLIVRESYLPVRFVTCNESGRIVANVPEEVIDASDAVLFVPDEAPSALQLMLALGAAEESAVTDRWRAFHGTPEHPRWVAASIESARRGPWVFDGEDLACPNVLIHDEPRLLRALNADPDALRTLCRAEGVVVESPVAVGVDQHGVHVRARHGVVFVGFPQRITDAEHASKVLTHMRERAAGDPA